MVLRIRDNNKTAADSVHLQHMTRRKRIIPETLENYRLPPRRKVAFSSDRMVPTGPNPLHNYSNISSEVIIPWSTRGRHEYSKIILIKSLAHKILLIIDQRHYYRHYFHPRSFVPAQLRNRSEYLLLAIVVFFFSQFRNGASLGSQHPTLKTNLRPKKKKKKKRSFLSFLGKR